MPQVCGVVGCGHNSLRDKEFSFFRLPAQTNCRGVVDAKKKDRRERWIHALHREDLTETKLKYMRICSAHFASGKPADEQQPNHPDYIPNQNMGHETKKGKRRCGKLKATKQKINKRVSQDYIQTLYMDDAPPVPVKPEAPIDPLLLPTSSTDATETPTISHVQNVACEEVINIRVISDSDEDIKLLETSSNHSSDTATAPESEMYMRETPANIYAKYRVISPNSRRRGVGGTFHKDSFLTPMEVERNFQVIRQKLVSRTRTLVNTQRQVGILKARVNKLNSVIACLRKRLRAAERNTFIPKVRKRTRVEKKIDQVLSETKKLTSRIAILEKKNDDLNRSQSKTDC